MFLKQFNPILLSRMAGSSSQSMWKVEEVEVGSNPFRFVHNQVNF